MRSAPFNPDPPVAAAILDQLCDPSLSFLDISRHAECTSDALAAWLARPDIAQRLADLGHACSCRARIIAASFLPVAAESIHYSLRAHVHAEQHAAPRNTREAHAHADSHRAHARRAAHLLLRIARHHFELTPPPPRPPAPRRSQAPQTTTTQTTTINTAAPQPAAAHPPDAPDHPPSHSSPPPFDPSSPSLSSLSSLPQAPQDFPLPGPDLPLHLEHGLPSHPPISPSPSLPAALTSPGSPLARRHEPHASPRHGPRPRLTPLDLLTAAGAGP